MGIAAGGYYLDYGGHWQAFAVSEVNGTWHTAIEVPATATLNEGWHARVTLDDTARLVMADAGMARQLPQPAVPSQAAAAPGARTAAEHICDRDVDVEKWQQVPLAEQERIFGRCKVSGAPMPWTRTPPTSSIPSTPTTRMA